MSIAGKGMKGALQLFGWRPSDPEQAHLQPLLVAFREKAERELFEHAWRDMEAKLEEVKDGLRLQLREACKAACAELGDNIRSAYDINKDQLVVALLSKNGYSWKRELSDEDV
jgi:hypothetical protein